MSEDQILEIIRNHSQDPNTPISRETRIEDAGIDSYGLIEVVFELEDQLKIDIPFNANDGSFAEAQTIGDLLDRLQALVAQA